MSSTLLITVKSDETQAFLQQILQLDSNKDREAMIALAQFFKDLGSGHRRGTVDVQTGSEQPVASSATATLVGVVAAETIVIAGVTLTASAAPATEAEFDQSGDDDADAASLALVINAHSALSKIVKATVLANVVTITSKVQGVIGNYLTLAGDTNITVSAANLENGAGGGEDAGTQYARGV